ncbi:MAG: SLC13 family permease [Candidatus Bipolaricaulota bacterium]
MDIQGIVTLTVFSATFLAIFSGRLHRAIASAGGAVAIVVAGKFLSFYSEEMAIEAINFNTLGLLIGMMILVGILKRTGFFEYLSIVVAKRAGERQFTLFLALCGLTAVSSAILDNVTTIVLVAPMTLAIADNLGVSATPYLMGEAMTSIIGGMGTLVGDPPNIIIGSAAGLSFNSFLIHLAPASVILWAISTFIFWLMFRFTPVSEEKISALRQMEPRKALQDYKSAKRSIVTIGMVVILYLTHSYLNLETGLVALIGATVALLWIRPDVKKALESIEWDAILFLSGLFVVVGGVEAAGLLDEAARVLGTGLASREFLAPILLVWTAGILSAVIDNIALTVAMVPILSGLGGVAAGNYLWWALAMGAALGGAASPVGSSSNVVAMSVSERSEQAIKSLDWLKVGIPVAVANLSVASLFLLFMIWVGY